MPFRKALKLLSHAVFGNPMDGHRVVKEEDIILCDVAPHDRIEPKLSGREPTTVQRALAKHYGHGQPK